MQVKSLCRWIFLILGGTIIITSGCSSRVETRLNSDDTKALNRIFETSTWFFEQSHFRIQIFEGGAVELTIDGIAKKKSVNQEGLLWLPIAIVKELPQYYRATEGASQRQIELHSYKVSGGLWGITALIPVQAVAPESLESLKPVPESQPLQLKLFMISPNFSESLNLLMPTGKGQSDVETSAILPGNAKFGTLSVENGGDSQTGAKQLILLPTTISNGETKAVAQLPSNNAVWDFSQITYSFSAPFRLSSKVYKTLLLTINLIALIWIAYEVWVRIRRAYFMKRYTRFDADEVRHRYSSEELYEIEKRYFERSYLSYLERRYPLREHISDRLTYYRYIIVAIVIALLLMVSLFQLSTWVFGQNSQQSATQNKPSTLSELGLIIEGKDQQSDKVNLALDFFALTDVADSQGMTEIAIGTGDSNQVSIEDVKFTPPEKAKIIQQSPKTIRASVTANTTNAMVFLRALADLKIERMRLPESYKKSLGESNYVRLEYTLKGGQKVSEHTQNGWLHYFPWDTKSIEIPLVFPQPVIVSHVELNRPSDFVGDISAIGLNSTFLETDKKYFLQLNQEDSRITLPPNEKILLKAFFRRTWFQRLFLTLGQLFLAAFAGVLLGYLSSLPDKSAIANIIQGLGIVGPPLLIRSSVFSTYKDLPSMFSGQSPTIFEIIFFISWILFATLTIFVWRRRKSKP